LADSSVTVVQYSHTQTSKPQIGAKKKAMLGMTFIELEVTL